MNLHIDAPIATVIVAVIVAISSMWQNWRLERVHTLVNSNLAEATAARVAAESALKTSNDLVKYLQGQLNTTVTPDTSHPPVIP